MSQYIKSPTPSPAGAPGPAQRGAQRSGAATASLILGIVSVIPFCLGPLAGIPALIIGFLALRKINTSGGQVTGRGLAIAGICLAGIGTLVGSFLTYQAVKAIKEADSSDLQQSRLEIAESNIRSKQGDRIGFGNTPEAVELANGFARKMKLLRQSLFTGESDGVLSGGEFLTHCELGDDRCAFIVHVPGLRKFQDDAKDSICDLAWTMAQTTLADSELPDGAKLAVGVKGVLLYEDIMIGTYQKESEGAAEPTSGSDDDRLEPFFPEPASPETEGEISGSAAEPSAKAGDSSNPSDQPN